MVHSSRSEVYQVRLEVWGAGALVAVVLKMFRQRNDIQQHRSPGIGIMIYPGWQDDPNWE